MSQKPLPSKEHSSANWPLTRKISFAATTLTFATMVLFLLIALIVNVVRPQLGDQPLVAPLMGAILLGGTGMAVLGLVTGIIDLTQSRDRRGVSVTTVLVNGGITLFIFTVMAIGFARS